MIGYYLKPFKYYFAFTGRSTRKEFWMFFLFHVGFSILFNILDQSIMNSSNMILGPTYSLVTLFPTLALGARRIHDVGKSGWFVLIPIYNLILFAAPGENGDNQYGSDPSFWVD